MSDLLINKLRSCPEEFLRRIPRDPSLAERFPEVARLDSVPAGPKEYHREGSALEHTILVVCEVHNRTKEEEVILSALAHDLGKIRTPRGVLPNHYGHASRGVKVAREMGERIGLCERNIRSMEVASQLHMKASDIDNLNATTILDMSKELTKSPLEPGDLRLLVEADSRGRIPEGDVDGEAVEDYLRAAETAIRCNTSRTAAQQRARSEDHEDVMEWVRQDRAEEFRDLID